MYLRDGKVGETFKCPRSEQRVVITRIEGGSAFFRDIRTKPDNEYGTNLSEVFPMDDWQRVGMVRCDVELAELAVTEPHAAYTAELVDRVGRADANRLIAQARRDTGIEDLILDTPWGRTERISKAAEGIYCISTASHGGLRLMPEVQALLPTGVRDSLMHGPLWAEEDCEAIMVMAILGHADAQETEAALNMSRMIDRYSAATPHLRHRLEQQTEGKKMREQALSATRDRITVSATASEEVKRKARQIAEEMDVPLTVESDPLRNHGQYAHADGRTEYSD